MLSSSWSAQLLSGKVSESDLLDLKRFKATVNPAEASAVTSIEEIRERIGAA
jgi:hypothetical protein